MIALPATVSLFPFALVDDEPWFLLVRPREAWAERWEPLRGEAAPNESGPAAAARLSSELGLRGVERIMDLRRGLWEHALAVRVEAPEARLDWSGLDDARWVPFHAAAALLEERDRGSLRQLNRVLDVLLRRVDVVFEEEHDEGGCSSGGCSTGGCSSGGCGTGAEGRGCGASPFLDGRPLSGEKVPGWLVDGAPSGCAGCAKSSGCSTSKSGCR
ncbi:MAG: hypothetical protein IT452_13600 [Planctomycetia bacterium]|nr:hypothetical protein [Planctomycetia bacterium]